MPFDINQAQESARSGLSSNFVTGEMKQNMVATHRGFYVHDVVSRVYNAGAEDVDQWAFTVEFFDELANEEAKANEDKPVLYVLTLGANPYRDGLAKSMKAHMEDNNESIGPLKLIKNETVKTKGNKPYDFAPWVKGTDDQPIAPVTGRAAAASFRPKPTE